MAKKTNKELVKGVAKVVVAIVMVAAGGRVGKSGMSNLGKGKPAA